MSDNTSNTKQRPQRKRTPRKRAPRTATGFFVWSMNGAPIPESIIKKFDDAMQKVMDENERRLRLAGTVVRG